MPEPTDPDNEEEDEDDKEEEEDEEAEEEESSEEFSLQLSPKAHYVRNHAPADEEAEEEESSEEWVPQAPPDAYDWEDAHDPSWPPMCRHGQHPLRCTLCTFDRNFPPH